MSKFIKRLQGFLLLKRTHSFAKRILLVTALFTLPITAAAVNEGLLESQANLDAGITLTAIPQVLLSGSETYQIAWTPTNLSPVILKYGFNPGSGIPANYPNSYTIPSNQISPAGTWNITPGFLPVGYNYCILTANNNALTSIEFNLVKESGSAVSMIYPQSDVNSLSGVPTTTPTFSWQPTSGVPYYHIILSDQAFEVETDPVSGALTTTGANIIWQVITSGTSITYGTPDPSGFFNNVNFPPLIGNTTQNRPTYNWVVLNNYGNTPAYSSDVVGELMAFEVATTPPFASPILISPAQNSILSGNNITFTWSNISQASSYHVYLTKKETSFDSTSSLYNPVWYVQTTINAADCPASNLMSSGNYRWKVIAEGSQGQGTMSVPNDFVYSVQTALARIYVDAQDGNGILGAQIQIMPVEGPSLPDLYTDSDGYAQTLLPYGTYYYQISKPGFVTLVTTQFTVNGASLPTFNYILTEANSTVSGAVVNNQNQNVSYALVTAVKSTGQTMTTETNNNGYFALDVQSGSWTFTASKDGYTPSAPRTISVQANTQVNLNSYGGPLQMTVNLYSLDGYVVNTAGEPISIATVTCTNGAQTYEATTGDNGYYNIAVGQGTWTLTASKPAFWLSSSLPPVQVINAGATNNIVLAPSANIISGVVFKGSVLANNDAIVRAVPSAGQVEETVVNQQGNFVLSLSSGNYQINAYLDGYTSPAPINMSLGVGQTVSGLNLILTQSPSYISGKVTSDGTNAVSGATVNAGSVTATTNSSGNYTLNVAAGPHIVTASKSGYATASSPQITVGSGQTVSNINITISPNASTINGTVLSSGQPVYQASMTARKVSTNAISTVTTLQNGSYSFGLTFGTYWIKAAKSGMSAAAPESLQVIINPGQTVNNINFTLNPNLGTITGTVLYNGQALSSALVNLTAVNNPSITYNTQADFYGQFNISVTPSYQYTVTVSKTGYISDTQTSAIVQPNGTQNMSFSLTQLQSQITGKVYSTSGNVVQAGATVTATKVPGGNVYTAVTNSVGTYTLSLNSGTYHITAAKTGYITAARDTTVSPGQTISNYHFYVQPNFASLQGFVKRNYDQTPLAGVLVSVLETSTMTGASAYTDAAGFYNFTTLVQGSYNITFTHPQFLTGQVNGVVLLSGSTTTQNYNMLILNSSFSGTSVNSFNAGLSGTTITAERQAGGVYTTQTGTNGTYTLSNIPSGTYNISSAKSGYTVDDTSNVVITANQTIANVNFQNIGNIGLIVGRVVSASGLSLDGVQIIAADSLGQGYYGNAVTTSSGYFTLAELVNNRVYSIFVSKTGYTNATGTLYRAALTANPDSANFVMASNNLNITGTVKNQSGTPKANIPVQAISGGITLSATTNSSGVYTITGAAPSTPYSIRTNVFSLQLDNAYKDTTTGLINLTGVNLTMQEHSGSFSGLVRSNTGQPLVNIQVNARRTGGANTYSTNTGPSGEWSLSNLFDGNWKIYLTTVGYSSSPDTINTTLSIGQQKPAQDFTLTEVRISISGVVRNWHNDLVPNVPLVAWSAYSGDTVYTNAAGAYSFTDILPNVNYQIATILDPIEYDNSDTTITTGSSNITNFNLQIVTHNASIFGSITNASGVALNGVTVNLECSLLGLDTVIVPSGNTFQFNYLYARDYYISFQKSGYITEDSSFSIDPSEQFDLGAIALHSVENGIYGTILDNNSGVALKNVIVTVTNVNTSAVFKDTTMASGSYQLSDLNVLPPNNVYTVTTHKRGFPDSTSAPFALTASLQKDFNIEPYPNTIYGPIKDQYLVNQPNAIVYANKFGEAQYVDTTNALGDYAFTPLAAGNYQIHSVSGTLDSYFDNVYLPPNDAVRLQQIVLSTGKLYGTVSVNGQVPPGSATVTIQNTVTQNIFTQQTASGSGSFYFSGLRENLFWGDVSLEGFAAPNAPINFTPTLGETDTVEFALIAIANAVSGFVLDSTNMEPVQDAVVYLWKEGEVDTSSVIASKIGAYSFGNLYDGDYEIWAEKSGFLSTANNHFSITLSGGNPQQQDIYLRSIPNSVSGQAVNSVTGFGVAGAAIRLLQTDGPFDSTIVTTADGVYLFTDAPDGNYILTAEKTGYNVVPANYTFSISTGQSISGKIFFMSSQASTFNVYGIVTHGSSALQGATVTLRSLVDGSQVETTTNLDGYYAFNNRPAPDYLQLRVNKEGYPQLVSEPFDLDVSNIQRNFDYPSGQIKFIVTADGVSPLENIQITVINQTYGVDTTIITNNVGFTQTANLLYGSNISPIPYTIIVSNYEPTQLNLNSFNLNLYEDQVLTDSVILGITYTPVTSVQINTPVTVTASVANELVNEPDFSLNLFYKGVGRTSYEQIAMSSTALAPPPTGVTAVPAPTVNTALSAKKKSFIQALPEELSSSNTPSQNGGGYDSGYSTFIGVIPAQTASGTMSFYLEANADGRTYSNISQQNQTTVTASGVLSILQIQPASTTLQWGYSIPLSLQTFDDSYNSLNYQLSADDITWSYWDEFDTTIALGMLTPIYTLTSVDSAALTAMYTGTDTGSVKIMAQVNFGSVTLAQIASIVVEYRQLDSIALSANITGYQINNSDSVTFIYNAYDINYVPMSINPVWTAQPAGLGTLTKTAFNKAKFKPYPGVIGQVMISVSDSLTGYEAYFNNINPNVAERGLFIAQRIENTMSAVVYDSLGFMLEIPVGAVDPGNSANISLRRPELPQVKKNSRLFEIHMDSYELQSDGEFSSQLTSGSINMQLTLPIPDAGKKLHAAVGHWDEYNLGWENLGGDVNADTSMITTPINGFSEYVVLGQSKTLSIEDMEFHPNPFSPKTDKKLQIEFTLNSKLDATPQITIRVFNMRGDLVRTLLDREPMPKGEHIYTNGVFQQGADYGSVEWDGLTEDGMQARNGRYIVHIKAEDPGGTKEKMDSVVLIK